MVNEAVNNEAEELRSTIDGMLASTGLYAKIREVIESKGETTRAALADLVSVRPLPELVKQVDDVVLPMSPGTDATSMLALKVEVFGGLAFAGESSDALAKGIAFGLRGHLLFNGQRGMTNLAASCVEPKFRGSYLFQIRKPRPATESEWRDVLTRPASMVSFCVTRERLQGSNKRDLVATASIDWRHALLRPGAKVVVPLVAAGPDSVLSQNGRGIVQDDGDNSNCGVAALRVSLDVVALGDDDDGKHDDESTIVQLETPFDETDARKEIQRSREAKAGAARTFYLHAKDWWREYTASGNPQQETGGVQLFARDETGELRCVCSFVWPLLATGRVLDSPRHCARFVSLLALEQQPSVGGGARSDSWHTPHAIVCRRAGDVWDHATLLCSLLLGFGIDAYVVLGRIRGTGGSSLETSQSHAWVISFSSVQKTTTEKKMTMRGDDDDDDDDDNQEQQVLNYERRRNSIADLPPPRNSRGDQPPPQRGGRRRVVYAWESATGRRCSLAPLDEEAARRYASIACIFNHEVFYATKRPGRSLVDGLPLDLEDPREWAKLEGPDIASSSYVTPMQDFVLRPSKLDVPKTEVAIEAELRDLIQQRRLTVNGLLTHWDPELAYTLQPALAAYEYDRVSGRSFGNDDFQDAIKRRVPRGHCFKGFPTCFSHLQPPRMLAALERGDLSADVLNSNGDHLRFALRVRIFPYAEDVASCWLMIAVRYLNPSVDNLEAS